MALANNAKMKDIITELQDMQMINGKSEVTNIIGSPVTASDTPSQIVTKVLATKTKMANNLVSKGVTASSSESVDALATKIGDITPATMGAKRMASGKITSKQDVKLFYFDNGSSGNRAYIELNSSALLPFKPSIITAYASKDNKIIYNIRNKNDTNKEVLTIVGGINAFTYIVQEGDAYVRNGAFLLPVYTNGFEFIWEAYE